MSKHSQDEVVRSLSRKRDCRIDTSRKTIEVLNGEDKKQPKQGDLGNGSWGKIDFLCNHCGYRWFFVSTFQNIKIGHILNN